MNELLLTELQKAYLSGGRLTNFLGGVDTHVYLEVEAKNISYDLLQKAWKRVLNIHPVLTAIIEDQSKLVFNKSEYNNFVPVFDLSGLSEEQREYELAEIRKGISHRRLHTEYGHTCGLFLTICSKNRYRIHFDLNLVICDVVSFQILLRDLANAYNGGIEKEIVYPKEKVESYNIEDELYWVKRVPFMPLSPKIEFNKNPEKMYGCQYKSLVHILEEEKWDNFQRISKKREIDTYIVLLAVFALTIHRFSKVESFLLNVPIFTRIDNDMNYLADDTKIILLESRYNEDNTFFEFLSKINVQYHDDLKHINFSGLNVLSLLKKEHPECKWPAPIVFSATPQIKLLSNQFCETIGELKYMVSQTPQVWLDAQVHEIGNKQYSYWMVPDELFIDDTINEMFADYVERLERLATDEVFWD